MTTNAFEAERMKKALRYLRLFLRDTPALNRLTREEESNNIELTMAIEFAIDDWNSTPPFVGYYTIANYPSLYMLVYGAAIHVLASEGVLQARNELPFNVGGTSFVRSNKAGPYLQWLINFDNKYQQNKRNMKVAYNIQRGWGGASSEYNRLGYLW